MTKEHSPPDESKPVQGATQSEEWKDEKQTPIPTPLPVVQSDQSSAQEVDPTETEEETDRKQDESIAMLADQTKWIKKQADWLRYQVIASSVLGVATMAVLIYHGVIFSKQQVATDGQLRAATDQLNLARKQFEAMDRPWVSIKAVAYGPLEFGKDYASLPIQLTATNVGQSAATYVTVNAEVFVGKHEAGAAKEAVERRDKLCRTVDSRLFAKTLFPGDPYILNMGFSLPNEAIEKGRMLQTDMVFAIFLVGCVDYTLGGQATHHQTGFVYEVLSYDPEAPHYNRLIRIGENLPSERIRLSKPGLSGDFAN